MFDGATVTDVAIRYRGDRRTLHRWLVRYANEGLAALADKSSKPGRCPHQMAPEIEARIVELRRSHPGWGPRTILNKLRRELETPPSRSAIYRCMVRHHLIQPKPRRRRRDDYKRWERSRSMELWQLDVLGSVFLESGIGVSVVTGIDDNSRFCVIAKVVARATARPVCDALLEALGTYGLAEQILTDIQTQSALESSDEAADETRIRGPAPTCRRWVDRTERSATPCLLTTGWVGSPPGRRCVLLGTR